MSHHKCSIEIPPSFWDQLTATMSVEVFENGLNAQLPTNIIRCDQSYTVKVALDMTAKFKRFYCGWWCIKVGVETCGAGVEFDIGPKEIKIDNCNDGPEYATFTIDGSLLCGPEEMVKCGKVFHFCVTAIALDNCKKEPLGIAGFCKVGPFMVY